MATGNQYDQGGLTRTLRIRVTPAVAAALRAEAKRRKVKVSDLVRDVLDVFVRLAASK